MRRSSIDCAPYIDQIRQRADQVTTWRKRHDSVKRKWINASGRASELEEEIRKLNFDEEGLRPSGMSEEMRRYVERSIRRYVDKQMDEVRLTND